MLPIEGSKDSQMQTMCVSLQESNHTFVLYFTLFFIFIHSFIHSVRETGQFSSKGIIYVL